MLEKLEDLAPWYSPRQAGVLLDMHEKTVRAMCEDGEITALRTTGPGGQPRWRISHLWLTGWVQAHTQRGTRRAS